MAVLDMADASLASPQATTPIDQIIFHARLIDPWRPAPTRDEPSLVPSRWSFFGLELALHGRRQTATNGKEEEANETLDFSITARLQQRERLSRLVVPFKVVVQSKMPLELASDPQKTPLQLLVPVQPLNTLVRINKIHFLRHCATGADVYRELERVLDSVSIARPCELTFLRHNHAQAAVKIRPFAARADVQQAQVTQFLKLQADESQWPDERKRRKQFVLQQMDFYREHYLYDHIGAQLQSLHDEIMGSGQWHAYEFEKALWYYHAPTGDLYAEHPMRTNEKTRQLIGGVQLRTRVAAKQLQHGVRRFLRANRVVHTVVQRLFDMVGDEIVTSALEAAWGARGAAASVNQLMVTSGSETTAEKLWNKRGERKTISSEPLDAEAVAYVVVHSPGRSRQEEANVDLIARAPPALTPQSPSMLEPEPAIASERPEIIAPTEPPITARPIPVEDESENDDGDVGNWRSRLRLLKQHQETRRKSPKRAKPGGFPHHSSVVAPRPLAAPLLLDRSSLLLDLAIDGSISGIATSLRETRNRTPGPLDYDPVDLPSCSPWRRDGSFRSFHAYFNTQLSPTPPSMSPSGATRLLNQHRPDKFVTTSRLPTVLSAVHTTATHPSPVSVQLYATRGDPLASGTKSPSLSLSPPKKLPYIRRRKPREP